jgi:small subunit ribosomal protein S17
VGKVVSDKMDKTVVVVYEWSRPHPIYKKAVRRQTKFYAHDPENRCSLGDTVRIIESRPYSKKKRWKVSEILSSIEIAEVQPEEIEVDEDILSAAATSAAQMESAAAEPVGEES